MSKNKTKIKNIAVLYHGGCSDGLGGAWAAWKKFGNKAEYIPLYREKPVPKVRDKIIYMIDFVYGFQEMKKLIRENKRVTAIDHHVTGKDVTKLTEDYRYAVNHSGAALAWGYFHPREKMPLLIRYIEDRDIWKWKLPNAHALLTILDFKDAGDKDFALLDKLAKDFEQKKKRDRYIEQGKLLIAYRKVLLEDAAEEAEMVSFSGYKIYAVNAPHSFASDLGHTLSAKRPPFAIVWAESRGNIMVSLRSNGKADVSKIAKKFGGGGHHNAAGFHFKASKRFPWHSVKK